MDTQSARNAALAECLEELGWPPSMLARKINRIFGIGTVSPSTPYYWVHTGGVPRPPLPALTAHVLARHLGRAVSVRELWQERAADSPLLLPADSGMDVPWSTESALQILEDWLLGGLMDRRTFLVVSGASLSGLAQEYLGLEPARVLAAIDGDGAGATLITQLETAIPALWPWMMPRWRSCPSLCQSSQFQTARPYPPAGGHNARLTRQLFHVIAKLGQHADGPRSTLVDMGWRSGTTSRRSARHIRRATGISSVHVLADLAFQAASVDARRDAASWPRSPCERLSPPPARVRARLVEPRGLCLRRCWRP